MTEDYKMQRIKTRCRQYKKSDSSGITDIQISSVDMMLPVEYYLKLSKDRHCAVCVYQEMIIGYVLYDVKQAAVEILDIVVDKNFRRLGVGTSLLIYVMSKCNNNEKIFASISSNNIEGQALFTRNKFVKEKIERLHRFGIENYTIYVAA